MIAALFYLQWISLRNRLAMRVRRMKQPKYLFGAIVGGLYFYFYFFRYLFHAAPRGHSPFGQSSPDALALWEAGGALILFVIVLLAWIIPHQRTALIFSEAEIAFLFPAPITRSGLVHFKLIRSQVRIFFTVFFLTLVSNRFGGNAWIHAAGWWLIFSTLNLHFLGCSFARTMLMDHGISNWRRRTIILVLLAAVVTLVIAWANKTIPRLEISETTNADELKDYLQQVLLSGPVPYLLYPFRLMVRPFFSPNWLSFLRALGPMLLVLALHYVWVVFSDVQFEEASIDASQKMAVRIAEIRSGNRRPFQGKARKTRAPFRLAPTGFAPMALVWKNLIGAGQIVSVRLWLMLAVVGAAFAIASGGISHGSGVMFVVAMVCGMFLPWSLLIGPQIVRQDLRQDLVNADVLKSFPMPGWQLVLGEVLAPAAILTGIQWLLLLFSARLLWQIPKMPLDLALAIVVGIAVLLPTLNVVLLLIPNAGVLLFPAWFQTGREGPQGIEATGQRLILMLGQLLAFIVTLIPAAVFFFIVFFGLRLITTSLLIVIPASITAALILAVEAFAGIVALGRVFERFDLSAELNS